MIQAMYFLVRVQQLVFMAVLYRIQCCCTVVSLL